MKAATAALQVPGTGRPTAPLAWQAQTRYSASRRADLGQTTQQVTKHE